MTLEKIVRGALRDSIRQHGPITEQNLSSAIKRVCKQVECAAAGAVIRGEATESQLVEVLRQEIGRLQKRLKQAQYGNKRMAEQLYRPPSNGVLGGVGGNR